MTQPLFGPQCECCLCQTWTRSSVLLGEKPIKEHFQWSTWVYFRWERVFRWPCLKWLSRTKQSRRFFADCSSFLLVGQFLLSKLKSLDCYRKSAWLLCRSWCVKRHHLYRSVSLCERFCSTCCSNGSYELRSYLCAALRFFGASEVYFLCLWATLQKVSVFQSQFAFHA